MWRRIDEAMHTIEVQSKHGMKSVHEVPITEAVSYEVDGSAVDGSAVDASAVDASAVDASAIDLSALDASSRDGGDANGNADANVDADANVTAADYTAQHHVEGDEQSIEDCAHSPTSTEYVSEAHRRAACENPDDKDVDGDVALTRHDERDTNRRGISSQWHTYHPSSHPVPTQDARECIHRLIARCQ